METAKNRQFLSPTTDEGKSRLAAQLATGAASLMASGKSMEDSLHAMLELYLAFIGAINRVRKDRDDNHQQ